MERVYAGRESNKATGFWTQTQIMKHNHRYHHCNTSGIPILVQYGNSVKKNGRTLWSRTQTFLHRMFECLNMGSILKENVSPLLANNLSQQMQQNIRKHNQNCNKVQLACNNQGDTTCTSHPHFQTTSSISDAVKLT